MVLDTLVEARKLTLILLVFVSILIYVLPRVLRFIFSHTPSFSLIFNKEFIIISIAVLIFRRNAPFIFSVITGTPYLHKVDRGYGFGKLTHESHTNLYRIGDRWIGDDVKKNTTWANSLKNPILYENWDEVNKRTTELVNYLKQNETRLRNITNESSNTSNISSEEIEEIRSNIDRLRGEIGEPPEIYRDHTKRSKREIQRYIDQNKTKLSKLTSTPNNSSQNLSSVRTRIKQNISFLNNQLRDLRYEKLRFNWRGCGLINDSRSSVELFLYIPGETLIQGKINYLRGGCKYQSIRIQRGLSVFLSGQGEKKILEMR